MIDELEDLYKELMENKRTVLILHDVDGLPNLSPCLSNYQIVGNLLSEEEAILLVFKNLSGEWFAKFDLVNPNPDFKTWKSGFQYDITQILDRRHDRNC